MNDRDLALHGAAINRHAPAKAIGELVGLSEERATALLAEAVATGRAIEAKDAYALTPLAGAALQSRYGLHFQHLRDDAAFRSAYDGFERINRTLKQIITDWQTLDVGGQKVANDHRDKDYDAKIVDRLGGLHEQAEPILAGLARGLPRLKIYGDKLLAALEAAEDGDVEWVSDIRRDSYHTVWFELHEELLRIMGTERDE
jgi:ribosomal protein S9